MKRCIQIFGFILICLYSCQVTAQTVEETIEYCRENPNAPICKTLGEFDCSDGVDNDGDGFIDYYDGDCLDDPNNPNDYIVDDYECQAEPVGNQFDIKVAWESENRTAGAFGMPMVADVDNDGVPEVISYNSYNNEIFILNGQDGSEEASSDAGLSEKSLFSYPATADVDGDGFGEIFISDINGNIKAFNHDLSDLWKVRSSYTMQGRQLSLADFNGDGNVELYQVNEIRDAKTGSVIIAGSHDTNKYPSANDWEKELNTAPVAVDILPADYPGCSDCDGLELVVGHIIYSVDISNGKLTERLNMNDAASKPADYRSAGYFPKHAGWTDWPGQSWSSTSIADFNQDGYLDVIMGGTTGTHYGPTTVFFWDIRNDVVKSFVVESEGDEIPDGIIGNFRDLDGTSCCKKRNKKGECIEAADKCTWRRGVGTLNIANIDADADLEITFMSGSSLYALDQNLNLEWANHEDFWESSSGFTGTAVFDFDGDGQSEIIYRDEINLYIVDGTTGEPVNGYLPDVFCSSQTQGEYPIIADVDGDGETEIIVSCGEYANEFGNTSTNTGWSINQGHIKVYKAANGNYWVPARKIWNQFSYFNVNVNDDLTIPRVQQPHHLNFAQICDDPNAPSSFSLNKFLNQSPRISYCGQLVFPAPKLDFQSDSVAVYPPVCPENAFTVRLFFENNGDAAVNQPIPVSFYSADPEVAHDDSEEPYLYTQEFSVPGGLQPGAYLDTTITVIGERGDFTLYVSLNDKGQYDESGTLIPNSQYYPLTELNGTVRECDASPTIVSKSVLAQPFSVLASTKSDNNKCSETVADNGEAEVVKEDGTAFPASEYDFVWRNINTDQVVGTDAYVSNLDSGSYEITVQNTLYNCSSIPDTVEVKLKEAWPVTEVMELDTIKLVSSCKPGTADGEARVLINGSEPSTSDYDILWLNEETKDTVSMQAYASALEALQYIVRVTNKVSGCTIEDRIDLTLDKPKFIVQVAQAPTSCKTGNGSVNIKPLEGQPSQFKFILEQLSPEQQTITSNNGTITGLSAGTYRAYMYDPTTECGKYSNSQDITLLTKKGPFNASVSILKDQTACEAPYNGQLTANIADPSKYLFTWYKLDANGVQDTVAVTATTPDTLSSNRYYINIYNPTSECDTTLNITLSDKITQPVVTITDSTAQTYCTPNGAVEMAASPAGNYTYYVIQGSDTLQQNTTGAFTGLEAGFYRASAQNNDTRCSPIDFRDFVIPDSIPAFETITFDTVTVKNCDPANPDGSLTAVVPDNNLSNYEYAWYKGVDTSNKLSETTHQLTGIAAGDYILGIKNKTTGCYEEIPVALADESDLYKDTLKAEVLRDQYYCWDDKKSGSIRAYLAQSAEGPARDSTDYEYYWYKGRLATTGNATSLGITSSNILNGLDVGYYSVVAKRLDGSQCYALDTVEVKVLNKTEQPILNIDIQVVHQTSCESNNANGELKGDVTSPDGSTITTSNHTFTWYETIDGSTALISTANHPNLTYNADSSEVYGLRQGVFSLKVENRETGCTGDVLNIKLEDNRLDPNEIKLELTSTEATDCNNPNGTIEVSAINISQNGNNFTHPITDYDYQWYYGADTTTRITITDNPTAQNYKLEGLEPGIYTVVATHKYTECATVSYTDTVQSSAQLAIKFEFGVEEQSDCINPDGGLSVYNLTGGSGSYSYQWFKGEGVEYPIIESITPTDTIYATNDSLSNIRSSKYTIRVTDIGTGCYKDSTYTLPADADLLPVPPATLDNRQDVMTCNPSDLINLGYMTAKVDPDIRAATYPSHADGDFFYYWFEGENPEYIDPFGDLGDPDNYKTFRNDPPVPGANKATISNLAPGIYTVIIVDAKDYVASGGTAAFGCQSDPRKFEIKAIAQSPLVILTSQLDTMCIGASGAINLYTQKRNSDTTTPYQKPDITIKKDGNSFTATPTVNEDAPNRTTSFEYTQLEAGLYEFTVTDPVTTCDTVVTIRIDGQYNYPDLQYTDLTVVQHQTTCVTPDGEVAVVSLDGDASIVDDYNYYWHDTEPTTSTDAVDDADHTGKVWSGRTAGWYYVFAQNIVTGCISPLPRYIEVKFVGSETIPKRKVIANTNCDVVNSANGSMTVSAYELFPDDTKSVPANGYTFEWYQEGAAYTGLVTNQTYADSVTSTITGLAAGNYTLHIINMDAQCDTTILKGNIIDNLTYPAFTAASDSVQNVLTCSDDGMIVIKEIKEGTTVITDQDAAFANYTFVWHQDDVSSPALPETSNRLTGIPADTFYVYVINTATGNCMSENPVRIIVGDDSELPLIYQDGAIPDFLICSGENEGAITVYGREFDDSVPALGYTYSWTMADGSAMPADAVYNADQSKVSNLQNGSYKVTIRNNSTNCDTSQVFTVGIDAPVLLLHATKTQDMTNCSPANGAAQIDSVTFGSTTRSIDDFKFEWFYGDLSNPIAVGDYGLATDSLSADGLDEGTYLIRATDRNNIMCQTALLALTVAKDTPPFFVLPVGDMIYIEGCDPDNKAEGKLEISAINILGQTLDLDTGSYGITWYAGKEVDPANELATEVTSLDSLKPGFYTTQVVDSTTGCSALLIQEVKSITIETSLYTESLKYTSCIVADGQVFAKVNGAPGTYQFSWYKGQDTSVTPLKVETSKVSSTIENLEDGTYTVVVSNLDEEGCEDIATEVVVEDGRGKEIEINIIQDFPVTNCDVANPNGQLSASVDGDISRYNFFWYSGRDITQKPIAKGPVASNLAPTTYTVIARDKLTGCLSGEFFTTVEEKQDAIDMPEPTVNVLSHVTHCTKPNGSAQAVLDSTLTDPLTDYEYIWTDKDDKVIYSSVRTNIITGLAAGTYQVTIYNHQTACLAGTGEVTIKENIYLPDFEIVTTPSVCMDATGMAHLKFTEPIEIVDILWETPVGYGSGFSLINQPPGEYHVTITDANGCQITKSATIGATLFTFNGVSPNGDGKNDKFLIGCIESFESQWVRIYNRAGAMVYENTSYDNETNYFEGHGNRGLYVGGDRLPDGTYFYIIDLKNGEKPVSGYLELTR